MRPCYHKFLSVSATFRAAAARLLQTALREFDLRVIRVPLAGKSEYESIYSDVSTYAPWNSDLEFQTVYKRVQGNTLVDLYRCYELWTLVGQTQKLGGAILEVGVWRGGTGALMAKRDQLTAGKNSVYLCDTFEGVVKAGSPDGHYKGGEHADTSEPVVEDLLRALALPNVRILKGIFPDQTARMIDLDTRFRLCHIDVDVYQSAKDVMSWIWDRMVPGGMIVYDDYGFHGCPGITRYVNEQASESDRLILHNLNGHAIVIKIPTQQDA
jgi:O-methyltransferase